MKVGFIELGNVGAKLAEGFPTELTDSESEEKGHQI